LLLLLALVAGLGGRRAAHADGTVVYEHHGFGLSADDFYGDLWKSQTFVPATTHAVTSVRLKLHRTGAPAGEVIVSIQATDASGLPTGSDLASGSVPCSAITSLFEWYEVSLGAGCDVQAGTRYAIVWRAPSADTSNLLWYLVDIPGTYAPECLSG
jgi:hypothetical protein